MTVRRIYPDPQRRFVAVVEARMTSTRLPGKVLLPVLDRPILGHLLDRLALVESLAETVVATTVNHSDDVIHDYCSTRDVECFRGSEEDVLGRVLGAARLAKATDIVEVTGDCPLVDPELVEQAIRIHVANSAEFTTNCDIRSYPDGFDIQVFQTDALARSASQSLTCLEREHVTLHMRRHPELFKTLHIVAPPGLHRPDLALTLDEVSDYELLKTVIGALGTSSLNYSCSDVLTFLDNNPEYLDVNSHVQRKGDS